MPSPSLTALYEHAQYRVRLASGGHATIRIGQVLPAPLVDVLPQTDAPWAFVTAWNPRSRPQPVLANRIRQRRLLAALRQQPSPPRLMAGVGVGAHPPWREPSLFVVGLPFAALDRLMHPFRQHAIVRGCGAHPTRLHWLD